MKVLRLFSLRKEIRNYYKEHIIKLAETQYQEINRMIELSIINISYIKQLLTSSRILISSGIIDDRAPLAAISKITLRQASLAASSPSSGLMI